MKKKISFLFISVLVALTMMMPCFADEATTDMVTEITTELVTEILDEGTTTVENVTTAPVEDVTPEETLPVEEDYWEEFKTKITDSATWTMIGTALATIITVAATIKSKFNKISSLVHNKADNETLKSAIEDMEKDLKKAYNANHKEISATLQRYEEALKNYEENEQRLYAIITLFMTNCKISESAKAEILSILAYVKTYDGSASEFVEQAQEAINNAKEEAPQTPTLDQMLEEDYMELG